MPSDLDHVPVHEVMEIVHFRNYQSLIKKHEDKVKRDERAAADVEKLRAEQAKYEAELRKGPRVIGKR